MTENPSFPSYEKMKILMVSMQNYERNVQNLLQETAAATQPLKNWRSISYDRQFLKQKSEALR